MNTSTTPATHAPTVDPDAAIRASRIKDYPRQLWWFIASFIALVSLWHLVSWTIAKISSGRRGAQTRSGDTESGKSPHVRPFSWRRIPLAIVNAYRVVAFRYTLHFGRSYTLNLAEVFVTCAYIIAIFTWEFANTTTLAGHRLDYTYWSSRAGAIGASQFPLITALGTKNNVVAYITGISYDKLNYVHRMVARVVFVLLWVHGGSKIALYLVPASYDEWFVRVGLTALIAFTILILVSLRPIRAHVYEVFYFVHFFSVLIILLGAYFHANNQRVGFYVWPSFLIWGLDRAIRFARLVYYNHLYFGFSSASHRLDATVELLSPHFVRLHMQRPPHFRWTPGQTAFLTMPTVSGFPLEAHPFTIASVDERYQLEGSESKVSKSLGVDKSPGDSPAADVAPFWNELTFLINVREGFTKRLAAIAHEGMKVKVLVDGPYGFSPDLTNDDTVVLVAGGSGVTFTLSTFLGVLSDVQNGRSRCQRLLFIWAIRDASHIDWISKTLGKALELAPSGIEISIRIFVTSGNGKALYQTQTAGEDDSVGSISEGTAVGQSRPPSLLDFSAVQVTQGRPDLSSILREEVAVNSGCLSVTVCGSQAIASACRSALRIPMSAVLKGGPSVVLHVESFGYA
ncbi:iron reductase [Trametes sanguinea]|nr:iron reductase [Trametes sanguinea]